MAVYGVTRVSTTAQADEGESLAVQARQIEGWALMQGVTMTEMFEERAVSGSVPIKERPEGGRMWAKLRKGDVVVAAKLDRMFRSALDALQMVEELKVKQVSLVLLDLGCDPLTNGMSRMFLTIAAAFAEAERDRLRERVTVVKQDQKARGRYLGGKVPYGYTHDTQGGLVEVEAEQVVIRRARELRGAGATLRAVQATLESEAGRKLSLDALQRITAGSQVAA